MQMEVYLDNSATTPVLPEVAELVVDLMTKDYGNPSSMHRKGYEAECHIKKAKEVFAEILKVDAKEIYFTSGGTESDNMAVIGAAMANRRAGNHLITTKIEHPAIKSPMRYLEEQGFLVDYLNVDENGQISLEELKSLITDKTILVSVMHVNNETGAVEPVEEAGALIKQCNPRCLFHVDAIQGFGKLKIFPKKWKIDLLSVSGHKIHGPKGTGILYISSQAKMLPILFGGGQQNGMRSGTENVPGIAGIGKAAEIVCAGMAETTRELYRLKKLFVQGLQRIPDVTVNGFTDERSAPHIVSVSVKGVKSEVLLHALEERNIYVSAGSACASNKPAVSETLKAVGLAKELLDSTVRFSFSVHTTEEEICFALQVMEEKIPELRKFVRR